MFLSLVSDAVSQSAPWKAFPALRPLSEPPTSYGGFPGPPVRWMPAHPECLSHSATSLEALISFASHCSFWQGLRRRTLVSPTELGT